MGAQRTAGDLARKSLVPLVILTLFVGVVWWVGREVPTAAGAVEQTRLEGATRFDLAAEVAGDRFGSADHALLAADVNLPEVLAAAVTAERVGVPFLLTERDELPRATLQALLDLDVERVTLVGSSGIVGEAVEHTLATIGMEVERLTGDNGYVTTARVATDLGGDAGRLADRPAAALVPAATPAAFAAASVAAARDLPLLLVRPDAAVPETDAALEELRVRHLLVAGDADDVSDDVLDGYREAGYEVERVTGAAPAGSAVSWGEWAADRIGWSLETAVVVPGAEVPIAAVGSLVAARTQAAIITAEGPGTLRPAAERWLEEACSIERVVVTGSAEVIADSLLADTAELAGRCPADGS